MAELRLSDPRLPPVSRGYDRDNEAETRRSLLEYIRDIHDAIRLVSDAEEADAEEISTHHHDSRYYTEDEIDAIEAGVQTQLSGKSAVGHSHVEADITDLQAYLLADADETITGAWQFQDQAYLLYTSLSASGSDFGFFSSVSVEAATTGYAFALGGYTQTNHASGNVVSAYGTEGGASHNGAGTVGTLIGHNIYVGIDASGSGNVTNAKGINIGAPYDGGAGSITNAYGIDIGNVTVGTANNYALRTGAGTVFLRDYTRVIVSDPGTAGPVWGLEVSMDQGQAATGYSMGAGVYALASHASGTVATLIGAEVGASSAAVGGVTTALGMNIYVGKDSGAGTITNAKAIYVGAPYDSVGSKITNAYGIHVGNVNVGTGNNYAIKTDGGVIDHAGNIIFRGTLAPPSPQTYTPTNVTTDRSYDANSTTLAEIADVLGTLIADLQTIGLIN